MKSLKKKGFSMIEMLIVLIIMGTIASQALPSIADNIKIERKISMESDIESFKTVTEKIMAQGYYAPHANFLSTPENRVFSFETDEGETYNYPVLVGMKFRQFQILDPDSEVKNEETGEVETEADYLSYAIIFEYEVDEKCLVFNKKFDAKAYWTTTCDPDELNWEYQYYEEE